jgi:deoxycytidylate deaminase
MKVPDDYLALAVSQAKKSPMHYKHGSVIWKSNKILGAGYNYPVAPPGGNKRRFSIHAERNCLKGLRGDQIYGADLLSVRIVSGDNFAASKPCRGCMKLLRRKNLKSIYWFDSDGLLNRAFLN